MVSLQDVTTVTPAAVAKDACMAETSLKKQQQLSILSESVMHRNKTGKRVHIVYRQFTRNSIEKRANSFCVLLHGTNVYIRKDYFNT